MSPDLVPVDLDVPLVVGDLQEEQAPTHRRRRHLSYLMIENDSYSNLWMILSDIIDITSKESRKKSKIVGIVLLTFIVT